MSNTERFLLDGEQLLTVRPRSCLDIDVLDG